MELKAHVTGRKAHGYSVTVPQLRQFEHYLCMNNKQFRNLRAAQNMANAINRAVLGAKHDRQLYTLARAAAKVVAARTSDQCHDELTAVLYGKNGVLSER